MDTHQNVNVLDHVACLTEKAEIDMIIEQGLEEISTQVSLPISNSRLPVFYSYI
jgi:hypothetical protein